MSLTQDEYREAVRLYFGFMCAILDCRDNVTYERYRYLINKCDESDRLYWEKVVGMGSYSWANQMGIRFV